MRSMPYQSLSSKAGHGKLYRRPLITCSKFSNSTKLAEYLSSCQNVVNVHTECRRNFTKRNTRLESECSEHGADFVPKKLQSSTPSFDWRSCCFFCGKLASVDNHHCARSDFHVANTLELYDSILDVCAKRMEAWALEVQGRLQSCHDFVATDAMYHQECSVHFLTVLGYHLCHLACISICCIHTHYQQALTWICCGILAECVFVSWVTFSCHRNEVQLYGVMTVSRRMWP